MVKYTLMYLGREVVQIRMRQWRIGWLVSAEDWGFDEVLLMIMLVVVVVVIVIVSVAVAWPGARGWLGRWTAEASNIRLAELGFWKWRAAGAGGRSKVLYPRSLGDRRAGGAWGYGVGSDGHDGGELNSGLPDVLAHGG